MAELTELVVKVKTEGAKESADQLDDLAKSGKNAEEKVKGVGKGGGQTVAPFKAMRGATQQASFQLQDIAVQAQSGTDAFIIIGQQGPQLASIFGPGGAVFGAFIAFGALIAGLAYKNLPDLSSAVADADLSADSLKDTYKDLTIAQKEFLQASIAIEMAKTQKNVQAAKLRIEELQNVIQMQGAFIGEKAVEKFKLEILEMAAVIDENGQSLETYNDILNGVTSETESAAEKERDYIESLSDEYLQLTLTGDALLEYNAIKAGATAESLAGAVALQREINAIKAKNEAEKESARLAEAKAKADAKAEQRAAAKLQREVLRREEDLEKFIRTETAKREAKKAVAQENLVAIEQALMNEQELNNAYEAEKIARLQADRDANLISLDEFETAKDQVEQDHANKRVTIAQTEEQAKMQAKMAVHTQVLGMAQANASQLASMAAAAYGEESAAYKAFFLLQQGLAIAQTIVSTQVAKMGAMASMPGPPGIAMAGAIEAMGAVSVGIIAGQTVAGLARANGGQVRGGESYLVGERGPELLTMGTSGRIATNENLKRAVNSDENSSKTQNVNVNFNIMANDTKGFDALLNSRRGQIVSMVNRAVNNSGKATLT